MGLHPSTVTCSMCHYVRPRSWGDPCLVCRLQARQAVQESGDDAATS